MREKIRSLVAGVIPYDDLEREHKAETLSWIDSNAPLFRIRKPDVPRQHLVCYFVLIDTHQRKTLLVDHKNALLWLPTGGHVEPGEDPERTVSRELAEELNSAPQFLYPRPIFITVARTVGVTAGHTDVTLWWALGGDCSQPLSFDRDEFCDVRWFEFERIPFPRSDPNMKRFVDKLRLMLARGEPDTA